MGLKKEGSESGYYIWWDEYGWHVRIVQAAAATGDTVKAGSQRVQGTITSNAKFELGKVFPSPDIGTVSVNQNQLTYDLPVGPTQVGFDFSNGCVGTTIRYELGSVLAGAQPLDGIHLGLHSFALSNPFDLKRTPN